ncbi:transketolase family protein [Planosporangium mesophilum]|uniref:Transketolase n=1 Tax=Planosporangium mesophilum TaxID=689768 RepID=A0A8J3TF45_9ACTN|nr:transketolase [Planosporangium mesophilum]NJC82486.1 transketolase [Planosporangium mesophilum]GII26005.1 transketolase [Planosporangium mesophilum]
MREDFIRTTTALLDDDPRTAVVLADISAERFAPAAERHPDRVVNVGIREQLMVGVAGGLALTGLRPYVHSYATFLIDRAYEQIKLDLDHQRAGAVLVSVGASYDASEEGRTHQSPGDVSLIDTLDSTWTVHVPGHSDEVPDLLRAAAGHDDPVYVRLSARSNSVAHPDADRLSVLRRGDKGSVVAVGPMLDRVLAATDGLDVTVAYTHTPRPFDAAGLRVIVGDNAITGDGATTGNNVVLVEPYLAGTSARFVTDALSDVPHRLLSLGVGRTDLRRYGSPDDHERWHGLDPATLREKIGTFIDR